MDGPIVGESPDYSIAEDEVPWLLGTQLTERWGPLARAPDGSGVLLIEAHDFARRLPYHHHKLTLVFAGMRRFRDRLRESGYEVHYVKADTFSDGLSAFFDENPGVTLVAMPSPSDGSGERLHELVDAAGGRLKLVENDSFVSTRGAFEEWAGDDERFTHEQFYRWMRRETGILVDGDQPLGGEWNYDEQNREVPPDDWTAPPVPTFEYDDVTERTAQWVAEEFDAWGRSDGFRWPVTRRQACLALRHFLEHRLPTFGPYQDAMSGDDWAMSHALLSPALNLGLLHPVEVCEAIESASETRADVDLPSAEGCIRQVLGWREFVRHVYRRTMPDLAAANQLEATRDLPECYWTGETEMACLGETVGDVHARGYAHHIQRLMVLANFATLWGVEPSQLNEWFHATFVDAYHWVTTPNVVEMGQYAHGVFATKPYVSSANYVDRMSDYCTQCPYDEDATTGENACPFNALYWDFLARNEDDLRSNHRMAMLYSHVDRKRESGELEAIEARVADLRERATVGDL
ncbi:cryptochrome/photolyase family protein [Halobiforma nitratireducens]|uniref:Deoxyribodipyrimidine photolyase-related protein n=1 Tax=Halobiforma nitratireducens JCM 10879 TaxID=1227454 RepID=M0MQZ0_9EURY|nr:cryptochrome/photolyase family protein [Halobiforma nitratireducens]EMA47164.1 deoxyribodipyrimidine photolyase-related protein [Halobiforma nitratireducens JCM 10879]